MPDFSGSNERHDSWVTQEAPGNVLGAILEALQDWPVQIEFQDDGHLELTIGSRFAYRMLGILTPIRMRPIRIRVTLARASTETMRLDVLVTSNEGWYAFNVDSVARRIFNSAFDAIFSALRNAAPGISQSTQGQHEQLVVAFNELIELLRTSNESEVAVSLEEDRVGIEAGTQPAMDHLDAALSPDGILGKLVINYADGREIAGKEFSGANRRLQELEEVCRKALRDRPQV